jgi:hypothetical protein
MDEEDDASMSGSESLPESWEGASDDEELGTDAEGSCQGASDDEDMAGAKKPKDAPWCKGGNKHINSKRVLGKLHPTHQVLAAAVTKEELAFLRSSRAVAEASHMARLFSSSGDVRCGSVEAMGRPPDDCLSPRVRNWIDRAVQTANSLPRTK